MRLLGHEEGAFQVHGDEFVEDLFGGGFHRALPADPGVIDEDIELRAAMAFAQFGVEGLEQLADPGQRADIALQGKGLFMHGLDLADDRGGGLAVFLVVDDDRGPGLGHVEGDGPADSTAGPGDDGDFSLQAHV